MSQSLVMLGLIYFLWGRDNDEYFINENFLFLLVIFSVISFLLGLTFYSKSPKIFVSNSDAPLSTFAWSIKSLVELIYQAIIEKQSQQHRQQPQTPEVGTPALGGEFFRSKPSCTSDVNPRSTLTSGVSMLFDFDICLIPDIIFPLYPAMFSLLDATLLQPPYPPNLCPYAHLF